MADLMQKIEVGSVLCGQWGYDQTNVDFYKVTKVSGSMVTFAELAKDQTYTGSMVGTAMPRVNEFAKPGSTMNAGKEFRRKVSVGTSGDPIMKLEKWGRYIRPWSGKPVGFSEYA